MFQAGLELLTSGNPPTLATQSARDYRVNHCTWPEILISAKISQRIPKGHSTQTRAALQKLYLFLYVSDILPLKY